MYDIQKQRHFVSQIDSQQGSLQNKHTKYKYFKGHKNVSSLLYNPTAMKLSSENKANERKKIIPEVVHSNLMIMVKICKQPKWLTGSWLSKLSNY